MSSVVLHVGFHKTASVWLREQIFCNTRQGFETPLKTRDELWKLLVGPSCLEFDAARAASALRPKLAAVAEAGRTPAVSWQRLSGAPDSGGYDSAIIARRLRAVFPDARVLLVVREQRSAIRSTYAQYFRAAGPLTLRGYLYSTPHGLPRTPVANAAYWRYDLLAHLYRELYGAENVLVLPYEWFKEEPEAFVEAVRRFGGVRLDGEPPRPEFGAVSNRSYSALCGLMALPWNRLTADDRISPGSLWPSKRVHRWGLRALFRLDEWVLARLAGPVERRWSEEIERFCRGRYEEGNRRLAEIAGHPLGGYGYAGVD